MFKETERKRKTTKYTPKNAQPCYAMLCKSFSKNLNLLINNQDPKGRLGSQRKIAKLLGVSPSTINRWTMEGGLPSIDKLYILAENFGITMYELLDPTEMATRVEPISTYYQCFISVRRLHKTATIETLVISDPILSYLVNRSFEIDALKISQSEKDVWYSRVQSDYAGTLLPSTALQYYGDCQKHFDAIDEYDRVLKIYHCLRAYAATKGWKSPEDGTYQSFGTWLSQYDETMFK